MTLGAILFMVVSWAGVLGLTGWSFARLLRADRRDRP